MLKNYFKVAWRNLIKNRSSSFINITGLATGMAVALLIGLWVWDEYSFDKYHKSYDRIAQVMQHQKQNGGISTFLSMPFPIGRQLKADYGSDFKYVVMASVREDHILTSGNEKFSRNGIYMDVDGARLLTLKMLEGSYNGLQDQHSILLSATAAKAIFGNRQAVNNTLKIDNTLSVNVTGVYEDLPVNSTFRDLGFIAPWDLYKTSEQWIINSEKESKWDNNSFQTFVQIADNTNFETINKKIVNCKQDHVDAEDKSIQSKIFLNPMRDWHLRSHWDDNGIRDGGFIIYVRLFTIIGIFVLLLACINFMNLSTARSEKRAKEVGIRKAVGSLRSQIIGQFYSESLIVVAIAFIFSILLVQLALPFFNGIADKEMHVPYAQPLVWLAAIGFIILCSVVAGSYPSLYLSSFKPIKVLKGTFKAGALALLPRKVLVVLQFTISIILVIGTMVVYKQVQYSKDRPLGYDRNSVMMLQMKSPDFYGKYDLLQDELKRSGAVTMFAESSSPLTNVWASNDGFSWPGKDPAMNADFATIWVTPDYGKTVSWQLKAGRDFSTEFKTDSAGIVLNEAAVKFMGLKDPVGTTVRWGTGDRARDFKVLGVVKDMVMDSPFDPVKHAIYFMDYNDVNWILLKLNPSKSASFSIDAVRNVFKNLMPGVPFDYKFADTEFASKFAAEERIGKLSGIFAGLAIFISCLGLFGMASFMAEQRTKEIGVRKVLGASVFNLWQLLSKEFVVLVLFSLLLATPLAYYFMHNWLQAYSYRTDVSWWIFLLAAICALSITLITVSFQSIKAALANPVKSLRTE